MIRASLYFLLLIATIALLVGPERSEARVLSTSSYNYQKDTLKQLSHKKKYVLARNAILRDQSKFAISLLSGIPSGVAPLGEREAMIARAYFQIGKFDKAIEWYNKVPKKSDFWLESMEEKGWALYRSKKYNSLKSLTETLLSPVFSDLVHPETYYLTALMHLDTCDYPGVLKTTKLMKSDYSGRVKSLENIEEQDVFRVFENKKKKTASHIKYGVDQKKLPLYFYRDHQFANSKSPIGAAKSLQRQSVRELKSISQNIKRLHLVEAEVIQRVYNNNDKMDGSKNSLQAGTSDTLVFPKNNDEIWADEIESFQASVKTCKPGRVTL